MTLLNRVQHRIGPMMEECSAEIVELCAKAAIDECEKSAEAALATALRERDEAREALKPFAAECDRRAYMAPGPDIDHWNIGGNALTFGDLRRARAALSPKEPT